MTSQGNTPLRVYIDGGTVAVDTTGLATEPKQDDIITALGLLGTEATQTTLGTEATLQAILTALGGGGSGAPYSASTDGTHVDADVADTIYAIVGIEITGGSGSLTIEGVSVIIETNDDAEWYLIEDPTVSGTFTYNPVGGSSIAGIARGVTANTVTGGVRRHGGSASGGQSTPVNLTLSGGGISVVDATRLVLCARPLMAGADINGTINWRE